MTQILMPKATAVWLIDNTSLSFEQIAEFCGLHPLEVKGIADGDVAAGIRGADPIAAGQLAREEIEKAEKNPAYKLKALEGRKLDLPPVKKRGGRYMPVSRRQERPAAIAWLLRNHPEVTDAQISKLLGTTKATIESIRNRTHWDSSNIKPTDPVTLGLATQIELDGIVQAAADKKARDRLRLGADDGATLRPAAETTAED
jgi:hypothetical protein